MPEGHTIHGLARDLRRHFLDRPVSVSSPQGRFDAAAEHLDGRRLTATEAVGKHLFVAFDDEVVHVHLGLIGTFRPARAGGDESTVRLRLAHADEVWDLRGPQTCALVTPADREAIAAGLGPDPLGRTRTADPFVERLGRTRRPLGAALLDQGVIAGIGNVYRAELCFLAGLHPATPAADVGPDAATELWRSARDLLRTGLRLGRIVTRDPDEVEVPLGRLADADRLYVYKRGGEPCRRCGTPVAESQVGGRTTWHCPECQPPVP